MSNRKSMKSNPKKRVVFKDLKFESLPIIKSKLSNLTIHQHTSIRAKRPSISQQQRLSIKDQVNNTKEMIIIPTVNKQLDLNESQATLDLLEKIRHTAHAESIGPMPLSLQVCLNLKKQKKIFYLDRFCCQACRFTLPFDLKLLENLTPLDYLSKYCQLSSRRQYQYKRLFDKYRNRNHYFESSYLYLSLKDIHKHHLTEQIYNYFCQLIDLNSNKQYQFLFNTYAGILALFERILYKSLVLYKDQHDYNLTKNSIEKCDFYSLDRKFDGLIISERMKQLLNAL